MPNDAEAQSQPTRLRVVLAIAAGFLAEVFTAAVVGAVIGVHHLMARGQSPEAQHEFNFRAAYVTGPLFGVIFTYVMASWVVRRAKGRYMAHAMLVAVGAVVAHILTAMGAPGGYGLIPAVADVLKLVAGATAAFVVERQRASHAVTA
ncbi:MAG TPA: hypothetical protein VH080_03065 [Gemmatimonadaceae bacterium]|nr:hypothetical protein [Gemmatimonadaceae bacterium]